MKERQHNGEIVVYQPDDITRLEVMVENETVWLTQSQLSALFQKDQSVIARHIKNVFAEGELDENSNMQILHNTLSKYKPVRVYSLDVIISVGYRVKSFRGTQFRRWANSILKEFLIRGHNENHRFAIIEKRLIEHEHILKDHEQKIDFFVRTSLPPVEGIFYDGQIFDAYAKGMEELFEGDRRCFVCYALRLDKTASVAKENGYDYFCSTLSISPLKNADKLNEIGEKLSLTHGVKHLPNNFKKRGGYLASIKLSKEYELYRQNYCGCSFSKRETV